MRLIPKIFNLLLVTLLVFGFFATILVRLYKQDFYKCVNFPSGITINTKSDCYSWGGDWVKEGINVESFPAALLTLFLMAST